MDFGLITVDILYMILSQYGISVTPNEITWLYFFISMQIVYINSLPLMVLLHNFYAFGFSISEFSFEVKLAK